MSRETYAVWELTLACNLACRHCGSRAGEAREGELTTEEALDTVRQLKEAGIGEVTLIGGEAYLRRDWLDIARAIVEAGMVCTLTTGGYGLSAGTAAKMVEAGIAQVSVSVDGLEATHDFLRGREGSWQACFRTLEHFQQAGMPAACNTQLNRLSIPELPELYRRLRDAGMQAWQWSMTVPMGNAADHPEILLQPYELLTAFPIMAEVKVQMDADGVFLHPGNNVGYYGPYHRLLHESLWTGCHAGLTGLGLEADGTVKGCPSLPTTAYSGGNLREKSLAEIVSHSPELNFNAAASTDHLWGFCRTCEHADLCRGGCTWTSHVFFGKPGNNPYCHHRAVTLESQGRRERLQLRAQAPGVPFDHGHFELIEEPL